MDQVPPEIWTREVMRRHLTLYDLVPLKLSCKFFRDLIAQVNGFVVSAEYWIGNRLQFNVSPMIININDNMIGNMMYESVDGSQDSSDSHLLFSIAKRLKLEEQTTFGEGPIDKEYVKPMIVFTGKMVPKLSGCCCGVGLTRPVYYRNTGFVFCSHPECGYSTCDLCLAISTIRNNSKDDDDHMDNFEKMIQFDILKNVPSCPRCNLAWIPVIIPQNQIKFANKTCSRIDCNRSASTMASPGNSLSGEICKHIKRCAIHMRRDGLLKCSRKYCSRLACSRSDHLTKRKTVVCDFHKVDSKQQQIEEHATTTSRKRKR